MDWEIGTDIYTLLCIKQITNENLLYSTGSSTQYSVMAYMGRKSPKRGDICVCIADSLCYTTETNRTLQSNYTPVKIFKKYKNQLT